MIQEIAPHSFSNIYAPDQPAPEDYILCMADHRVLCSLKDGEISLPTCAMVCPEKLYFGFRLDGRNVFLSDCIPDPLPEGFAMEKAYDLRAAEPMHLAYAIGVGGSLLRWYGITRFCGKCGAPMEDSPKERARICPQCGNVLYPRICPAVIVAVCDHDRLLLTRYKGRPFKRYALVAGFNEIGESIEDTVHREVMEETGLKVRNLRFYRSQPWVFTDSLLMGFFAELDGSDEITMQEDELAEAAWCPRDAIPGDYSPISLTGEMISLFRAGKEPKSEV